MPCLAGPAPIRLLVDDRGEPVRHRLDGALGFLQGRVALLGAWLLLHAASPSGNLHGCARSNAAAARSTSPSAPRRPMICSPTGSPSTVPQGTVAAGWPLTLNGYVSAVQDRY